MLLKPSPRKKQGEFLLLYVSMMGAFLPLEGMEEKRSHALIDVDIHGHLTIDEEGNTSLHRLSKDLENLTPLMSWESFNSQFKEPVSPSTKNKKGQTALHVLGASTGTSTYDFTSIEYLTKTLGLDINEKDAEGKTPLLSFCERFDLYPSEVSLAHVKSFLRHEADPSIADEKENLPISILAPKLSSSNEIWEAFKELLSSTKEVNIKEKETGETPFHKIFSAYSPKDRNNTRCFEAAKLLVAKKAYWTWQDNKGDTPLHKAVSQGVHEKEFFSFFLENLGAPKIIEFVLNKENNLGQTPFFLLAEMKFNDVSYSDLLALLLKKGADVTIVETASGKDSIHQFMRNLGRMPFENKAYLRLTSNLLKKTPHKTAQDNEGNTYFHHFLMGLENRKNLEQKTKEAITEYMAIFSKMEISSQVKNQKGVTPQQIAAEMGIIRRRNN